MKLQLALMGFWRFQRGMQRKRTPDGVLFFSKFKQVDCYSILALLRNSTTYSCMDCCCRRCSICGFSSSNVGIFKSRTSSSLMMCQPNWDFTGSLVYWPFFRLSSALAKGATKLLGTAQSSWPPFSAEPASLDFAFAILAKLPFLFSCLMMALASSSESTRMWLPWYRD